MKKGAWISLAVVGALLCGGVASEPVWKPAVERYASRVIQEQLNNALEGSATYQSLQLDWSGSVNVQGLEVKDDRGGRVASVPALSISLRLGDIWRLPFSKESALSLLTQITLQHPTVWAKQDAAGDWNVNHLMKPSNPNTPMSFRGQVRIEDGTIHVVTPKQQVTATHVLSTLNFNAYPRLDMSANAVVDGQSIVASGSLNLQDKHMDLSLLAKDVHIGQYVAPYVTTPVEGVVDATMHVTGTLDAPQADGIVSSRRVAYDGYEARDVYARWNFNHDVLHVNELGARIDEGHIVGLGSYDLKNQSYQVAMDMYELPLSLVGHATGQPISGTISGSVRATGQGTNLQHWSATAEGSHVRYETLQCDHVAIGATGTSKEATINYVNGTMGHGAFTAYGTVNESGPALTVGFTNLNLANANAWLPKRMEGFVTGNGTVDGTWDNLEVHSKVAVPEGSIGGEPFRQVYADVDLKNHKLEISHGYMQGKSGSYHVSGWMGLTGDKPLDMTVSMDAVRIENMIHPLTKFPVTGWLDASTHITGTVANPVITGAAHAWDGSVYGKLISDVRVDYTYDNNKLSLPTIQISAYGAQYYGTGYIDHQQIHIDFNGNDIDTSLLLRDLPMKIGGIANMEGHVSGTIQKPILEASVVAPRMHWNQATVEDVSGNIYADPTVVYLEHFGFSTLQGGRYLIKGGIGLEGDHRLFGTASVRNGSLKELLKVADVSIPNLDGKLIGDVTLGGTLKRPEVSVQGKVEHTTIGEVDVGTSTIDAGLQGRKITIKELKIPLQGGVVAALGTADLDGNAAIQIAANHAPVQLLMPLTGKTTALSGDINFIANVTGRTNNPKVELSAELLNGVYNGVTIDKLIAMATMQDKVINIDQILGQKGPYQILVNGKVPLAALYTSGYLPPGSKNAMDLTIDMNGADLGVLPLITPYITNATGKIRGKLQINGTYDHPQMSGAVGVNDGTIFIKGVKKPLQNIQGSLWAKGTHLELTTSGAMGKGTFGVSGALDWTGRSITKYQGAIQSHGLDVQSEYFTGPLNGDVYVFERNGMPTLAGNLTLAHNTISIPMSLSSSDEMIPLALDFTVSAGRGVRLYNSVLYNMLVEGSAHFGGKTTYPMPTGGFKVTRGSLKYLSNQFTINEGQANFEPGSLLPNLRLKATANIQNYQVKLGLTGPLDQMDFSLSSEPRLTQEQIISLMTFGRQGGIQNGLNSQDASALLAAGLRSLAIGYLENVARDNLGLDNINITTGSISPIAGGDGNEKKDGISQKDIAGYYNLKIGKYIMPNLMVTWTRGLNNDQMSYGLQYDITRSLSLSAWTTNDNQSFVGGLWHYTF